MAIWIHPSWPTLEVAVSSLTSKEMAEFSRQSKRFIGVQRCSFAILLRPGQEKEWLNRLRNDFYFIFATKLGKNDGSMDLFFFVCKSMEICFIHFHSVSFLETWANGFQPFQTKPLHTISQQHSNGKNWRPWGSKHGIQPWLCAVASHAYAWSQAHWSELVGMDGCMRYWMICSFFLWSMHMHSKLESKKLTKVYTLVYLHQPEFPSHFTSNLPFWRSRNWTPNLPTLHAFLPSFGGFLAAGFPSYLNWSNCNNPCRFLFLILASKSDFNIFGYPT